jgi:patatin-related protein
MNPESTGFVAEQEIRLALVLYGGVSLAIYINGVTQELFELVRATAPDTSGGGLLCKDKDLTDLRRVYRRLGQMLGSTTKSLAQLGEQQEQQPEPPVRTRFVIDVISGTSAGGINGIVLAKALANQQEIKNLQKLWEDEVDIEELINDRLALRDKHQNLRDRGLKLNPPEALLNSQRLYVKVLDALRDMDTVKAADSSPYVDELDLFVTTTDLDGLQQSIRLADEDVLEKRYKNVFHFVYAKAEASGEARNDFEEANNPFLAFTARCTSSFPFAFDPMRLDDIKSIDPYCGKTEKFEADVKKWQPFFKAYPPENFPARNFGDGGYLDNKPFSYATDTLLRRRALVSTRRKLIYVEPAPEELLGQSLGDKPDAISNAMKALVTLPGYETIRQDVERVDERNRLIERVRQITDHVERDVEVQLSDRVKPVEGNAYGDKDLAYMIGIKGISYGGYHRLKVSAVTDELAELIAKVAHVEEDLQNYQAIRELVGAWRRRMYTDFLKPGAPPQSENRFLVDLDLSYRLRRISFLRMKIEELYGLDLDHLKEKAKTIASNQGITEAIDGPNFHVEAFSRELRVVKVKLNKTFIDLRRVGRDLRAGKNEGRHLPALVEQAKNRKLIERILKIRTSEGRRAVAEVLLSDLEIAKKFDAIACDLIRVMRPATEQAAVECRQALWADDPSLSVPGERCARAWIRHYYDYFDDYDMITFPITYGTEVGEATTVEIIRVSPADAKSIVNENKPGAPGKLAGTTLLHFGGFLDRLWRQNDMLWGRLDAAERIINTMLPDGGDDAKELVTKAHTAILQEELAREKKGGAYHSLVQKLLDRLKNEDAPAPDIVKDHPLDPERMVRTTARATTVIGKMLDDITDRRGIPGHRAAVWLARVGTLLWGLVEVSVPHSFANLVFRHWLTLLYLFEAFLIVGGIIFNVAQIQKVGLAMLGATFAVNLAVLLTGAILSDCRKSLRWSLTGLIMVGLILIFFGIIEVSQLLTHARQAMARIVHGGAI